MARHSQNVLALLQPAKGMGWHIVDYSEKEGRIEATDHQLLVRADQPTS